MDKPQLRSSTSESTARRPARKWRWRLIVLRVVIVAAVLVVFRYQLLAWCVGGYDSAWRQITGERKHHPACLEALEQLGGPGVRMLVHFGEAGAVARIDDHKSLPALIDVADSHHEPMMRSAALYSIGRHWDDRVAPALCDALADPSPQVRLTVARVIIDYGNEQYREPLAKAIAAETDSGIKAVMELALKRLQPMPVEAMDEGVGERSAIDE